MTPAVAFTIPGRLVGKGRPRAFMYRSQKSGELAVGHYTPQKTEKAEDLIRFFAHKAMAHRALFVGPLWLSVDAYLHHPKSWSNKKKIATRYVTGKPDADNSIKTLADSLNQIVWHDDSQIAKLHFCRTYTDGTERVAVTVYELNGAPE